MTNARGEQESRATEREPTESRSVPERLGDAASSLAEGAGSAISAALRPVGDMAVGARRAIGERSGARVRRVRQMGRRPLANMWDVHPQARQASAHERGLCAVPIEQICGTAVEGPTERGGDFLPLRERRGANWRGRWQRIRSAMDSMVMLPPVDLIKVGDCFWVTDGHNRVAAALYAGVVAVDANVTELRLPGQAPSAPTGGLAAYVLESSQDVRAAGSGRLTRTSVRPSPVLPNHDHAAHDDAVHDEEEPAPPTPERE